MASLAATLIVWAETAHYAKHRHWLSYGAHVDVISDSADGSHLLWANVKNFAFRPVTVEVCVLPNDLSTPQAAVSPLFDVQKRSGTTGIWERAFPNTQIVCPAQTVSRTIRPLASYDTQAVAILADGFKTGDYIRFAIIASPRSTSPTTLLSSPFPIVEQRHH